MDVLKEIISELEKEIEPLLWCDKKANTDYEFIRGVRTAVAIVKTHIENRTSMNSMEMFESLGFHEDEFPGKEEIVYSKETNTYNKKIYFSRKGIRSMVYWIDGTYNNSALSPEEIAAYSQFLKESET